MGRIAGHRLHRFRDVVNGLFGLLVVLSAFALTDVPINSFYDLSNGICVFVPLFLFVIFLWRQVGELLDVHPPEDRHPERLITVVMFVAMLVPVTLRIDAVAAGDVHPYASLLTSAALALAYGLLAYCALRASRMPAPALAPADRVFMQRLCTADLIVAVSFLVAMATPPTVRVWVFPLQRVIWIAAFFVPNVVAIFWRQASPD